MKNIKHVMAMAALILPLASNAQVSIDVYPTMGHKVGDITHFDREKYIVMPSGLNDNDWSDEPEALKHLLVDCDAYFGRDNGSMGWNFHSAKEDPNRKGHVLQSGDQYSIEELGAKSRKVWTNKYKAMHKYDDRSSMMVGGQISWCWPGTRTRPYWDKTAGYESASGEAVGEYMGLYLNNFFRKEGESVEMGQKEPKYLEVVNEPFYALIDDWLLKPSEKKPPIDIFNFHNDVARGIRMHNDRVQIGGYTVAFPYFDLNNFERWNERMRLFIDMCGENMDFISVHFYDFNRTELSHRKVLKNAKIERFRGGRIEATLDMMEQYSYMRHGKVIPFIISEYGGRNHQMEREAWSAERDWVFMKSFSPMMMSFMDRPNNIIKAIPFVMTKVKYDEHDRVDRLHPWRMFRHADEPVSFKDPKYVFTEQIKFYEFWANVKGARIATQSSNPDIMTDAYLDDNKLYLIVHNLDREPQSINISHIYPSKADAKGKKVRSIVAREFKWGGDAPVIADTKLAMGDSYMLSKDGTLIVEYTYGKDIDIKTIQTERKYYAETYLQPIEANKPIDFNIKGVDVKVANGTLRISMGRELNTSRQPKVSINGVELKVSDNYMGDDQASRGLFFGMTEVSVPGSLIRENNTVSITFDDEGGFVSSLTMQTFGMPVRLAPPARR